MKNFPIKFENGILEAGLDTNNDGENAVSVKLDTKEGLEEAFARVLKGESTGEKITLDGKTIEVEFGVGGVKLKVDTDRDGEPLLVLDISLMESFDEIQSAISKKGKE